RLEDAAGGNGCGGTAGFHAPVDGAGGRDQPGAVVPPFGNRQRDRRIFVQGDRAGGKNNGENFVEAGGVSALVGERAGAMRPGDSADSSGVAVVRAGGGSARAVQAVGQQPVVSAGA